MGLGDRETGVGVVFHWCGNVLRAAAMAVAALVVAAQPATAQDPAFLVVNGGYFDFNRQKHPAGEFGLQYRSDQKLWIFQPMVGVMRTTTASTDIYAGISLDIFFGDRFVVRPSFAPSYYNRGAGHNLGYALEFRSAIEFAYRFDDRSRLGLEIYHMSNAGLGNGNPGEESAILTYALPMTKIAHWLGRDD
jgi:lipid A 3-O-deacylase